MSSSVLDSRVSKANFIRSFVRFFHQLRGLATAAILIALTVAALSGCISESKGHLDRARILFDRRDLKGARLQLTAALKADPGMLEARKMLARVDEYLGDQQDAALQYEAAARLDPADAKLRNKARFYRQQVEHRPEPSGKVESMPGEGLSDNALIGRGRHAAGPDPALQKLIGDTC